MILGVCFGYQLTRRNRERRIYIVENLYITNCPSPILAKTQIETPPKLCINFPRVPRMELSSSKSVYPFLGSSRSWAVRLIFFHTEDVYVGAYELTTA